MNGWLNRPAQPSLVTPNSASSVSPDASTTSISQLSESILGSEAMTQEEFSVYAKRAGVVYPTTSGADLYRICTMIPKARRAAFENGLGDAVRAFYEELAKVGTEPTEPEPDPVESFVRSSLVTRG